MTLTAKHLHTFDSVVDTILPSMEGDGPVWTTPGAELGFGGRLDGLYSRLPHDDDRKDLRLALDLLGSPVGGVVLYGKARSFVAMKPEQRASAYRRMESHPMGLVRRVARALKILSAYLWVTTDDPHSAPASWGAMGYPGPDGPAPEIEKPITPLTIRADTVLTCDVVVVGSGAGGGTAAGVLAAAGLDVIVLEAGGYGNEADFSHLESDAYERMYLDGALNATADGGIVMLAGATLGGGTVVNYTTSFATPQRVRAEWDRVARFDGVFEGEVFGASTKAVEERLGVNLAHESPSARDQLMEKGLRELGWHVGEMPRNAVGCREEACGYCTMGCRIGAKQSTLKTYLQDACSTGARIVVGAKVEYVTSERGEVTGVLGSVGQAVLTVRAKSVVLAAGSLHTPAILLRSRVGGPATGRYLRLHPVTAVWARFEERVDPWTGILQTRFSDEHADLDRHDHGFKFETAPIHPLFPAAFIGWEDGPSFKTDILGLGHISVVGILLRDRDHGRVVIRRDGTPRWRYAVSEYDQLHVREGVRRAALVAISAGASEVLASTIRPVRWRPGDRIDDFVSEVDDIGYASNRTAYFSFHQMGSARMGAGPADSVVGSDNQAHDLEGLYVMDGSCFPTASGVNPMLSIAAIAHRGATLLAEKMG